MMELLSLPRPPGRTPMPPVVCGAHERPRVLPAALALLVAALAACASPTAPAAAAAAVPATPDRVPAAAAPASAELPKVVLTGELLGRLMLAEISLQRGEPGLAYTEFMTVAKQTRDPRVARRATEVALGAHALPQAVDAAALWYGLTPADPDAAQSYSSLLVATGRYDVARPILEQQLAAAANPIEVLDRLQRVLTHAPEPARGYALLDTLARRYFDAPQSGFDARLIVARGAHLAGDDAAAVRLARSALELRPDSELAVVTVTQLLIEGGARSAPDVTPPGASSKDHDAAAHAEALAVLERFVTAHPAAYDARLVYARLLVGEGRLDQARGQFEELLQHAPQNPDPLFALGVLALESERYDDARGYLERYLAAVGTAADRDLDLVYLNMARVAEGQRRLDEALDWLHKVRGTEQQENARVREAFLLGRLNRVEEGLQLLQQAPGATAEERTQRVVAQGQLLRESHRYQESYDLLDKALAASPDDTSLLYESAMSAERLDRIDLMEARLRHLLQLQPDYAHAYNALGYTLADRNIRLQEAYRLIDHALTLKPDDAFIVDSMGWVQYRLGNLSAARDSLMRAFQLKADPDVAAHLGEVLWATGDHSGAREILLNAQKRDGDSDTLRDTLQRLKIQP